MTARRALIAVPLPPPATWQLIRSAAELPRGYAVVGSIVVGTSDAPALPARAARRRRLLLEAPGAGGLSERCPYRREPP